MTNAIITAFTLLVTSNNPIETNRSLPPYQDFLLPSFSNNPENYTITATATNLYHPDWWTCSNGVFTYDCPATNPFSISEDYQTINISPQWTGVIVIGTNTYRIQRDFRTNITELYSLQLQLNASTNKNTTNCTHLKPYKLPIPEL